MPASASERAIEQLRGFVVPRVDATLCYQDLHGSDPPLVFLHGLGGASSEAFVHVVRHPRLGNVRVLLIDLLGFGYSERPLDFGYTIEEHADCVAALIEHLGLRSVHLVGHSMGGSVAIALASRSAHLIGGVVVAEGTLDPGGGGRLGHRVAAWREEDYAREGHTSIASGLEKALGGNPSYFGVLRTIRMAAPHAMHRSATSLIADRSPTFRSALQILASPRTYLIGERSLPDFPEGPLPTDPVKIAVVPDAGHLMNVDNPDAFAVAIATAFEL